MYHRAAQAFRQQNAQTAYALYLFRIAESYRSPGPAEQTVAHQEACLPLVRELGSAPSSDWPAAS